jgi:sugar lactone lactonase YvrE
MVNAASGRITTIAGNGQRGYGGDDGPAASAALNRPEQVTVDSSGNVFIADTGNHRVRKFNTSTQVITNYAGTGEETFGGDGRPALQAGLKSPCQLAFDAEGNLFVADSGNARIRKITSAGVISTVAGSGQKGFDGDGRPATGAALASPDGVAVDGSGQIYIVDTANYRLRRVDTAGIIRTLAGNGHTSYLGDSGPAWGAALKDPWAIAADSAGNAYIADQNNLRIRKVDAGTGIITTVAGSDLLGYSGDNGPATQAGFSFPRGVAVDSAGNIFIADTLSNRIRKVDAATRIVTTVAGNGDDSGPVDNVRAVQSAVVGPWGIAIDSADNLLIAETGSHKVRRVDRATGIITTVAGFGFPGYLGDGLPATLALLNNPVGVAADRSGNIYIADNGNNRVHRVGSDGTLWTVAGNGQFGYSGEGGPATAASLAGPNYVIADGSGNLYITGIFNRVVRVDAVTGIMTTIAGSYEFGFRGDGGPAASATFLGPVGLAFDPAGSLFIADQYNGRVRVLKGPVR